MNAVASELKRTVPVDQTDRAFVASQWQLMWWKFRKHKPAIAGGLIIIVLYLIAIFSEVVAVYDPKDYSRVHTYAPPQRLRFVDQGRFQLQPFVYGWDAKRNTESMRMPGKIPYRSKKSRMYRLRAAIPERASLVL